MEVAEGNWRGKAVILQGFHVQIVLYEPLKSVCDIQLLRSTGIPFPMGFTVPRALFKNDDSHGKNFDLTSPM